MPFLDSFSEHFLRLSATFWICLGYLLSVALLLRLCGSPLVVVCTHSSRTFPFQKTLRLPVLVLSCTFSLVLSGNPVSALPRKLAAYPCIAASISHVLKMGYTFRSTRSFSASTCFCLSTAFKSSYTAS